MVRQHHHPVRFAPLAKKAAVRLWHRARDFDRTTRQPGRHADAAFDAYNRSLRPVSKKELFREFMLPADLPDDQDNPLPARDADAALAFLVERGLVEVAGDTITVPARFWNEEDRVVGNSG